jgi:hypothetical protein
MADKLVKTLTLQQRRTFNSYSLLGVRGYLNIKNGKCNLSLKSVINREKL